jgi:hypothetical protein
MSGRRQMKKMPRSHSPSRNRRKENVHKVSENDVLKQVSQWLALRKIPHWRINSGGLKR